MCPSLITAGIATTLGLWATYALSGAGVIRRLPCLRLVLLAVAGIFLARGLLAIPLVLVVNDPYLHELRGRMAFMVLTSAICAGLGVCYAIGAVRLRR